MKPQQPAPLCIASPTRRSGTTLLQRLLCSASDTLIYGESCANDLNILASLLATKQLMFGQGAQWRDAQLERVLAGRVNEWIADLMPPVSTYLQAYQASLLQFANQLASYAAQRGRPVWGVKMAQWNPAQLLQLKQCLPGTKVIYLHRQLEACVRSAKRLELVVELPEVEQFARTWRQFSDYARQHLQGPDVLHLDYEELVEAPAVWLPRIAAFAGSGLLDASVLQVRLNTEADDPRLAASAADYLVPATLSEAELELIVSYRTTPSAV